jgi:hypothetical protein
VHHGADFLLAPIICADIQEDLDVHEIFVASPKADDGAARAPHVLPLRHSPPPMPQRQPTGPEHATGVNTPRPTSLVSEATQRIMSLFGGGAVAISSADARRGPDPPGPISDEFDDANPFAC